MRENAGLALIRPVQASTLVAEIMSIDASRLGPRLLVRRMRSFLFFSFEAPGSPTYQKNPDGNIPLQVAQPSR